MADKTDYEAKLQEISQLTADTEKNLTRSKQNWIAFLTTASRLYKYPYNEQLMIYAQRPEATACAEFNIWNQRMNRYVRRGSKGIALLNNDGDNPEIRYVFDVSDTGTRENSRSVNQWLLTNENEQAVMTALSEKYDVDSNRSISVQLESIAAQLVDEFWNNHKRTIIGIVDDSFLEEYDEDNIGMAFRNAGVVSTIYALLSRCGLDPDGYFEHEDFLSVFDFNTPGTVAVLGSAVSECAEDVLRQIEITIKTFEKERSKDYGRNHLQTERGLSHSEPQIEGQREETSRQVRQDEKSVPEGTQPDTVESPHIVGETVRPPSRSGRIGNKPHGAAAVTVEGTVRSDRGTESERPDEVGTVDEQHTSDSRGNSAERADIQLTFAERFLKGKHAFIVCTHTDKAHIHNHIYFNSTTLDCKRKFRDKFFISKDVARLSDLICIEHSLSVVENPQRRNTAYNKWEGYQKVPSLRDLLRSDIDEVLKNNPKDFDDFISQMKVKGYLIKFGKHITFLNPRQKKNIRLRSLGKGYSEEEIKAIIRGNKNHREKKSKQKTKSTNLLIDVQQKLAEGKGKGYENWAKVFNLKQMAKTVLYLQENGFADYDEFSKKTEEMTLRVDELREEIKTAEKRIEELTVLREQILNYLNTRETFSKYKASGYSKKFYAEHESGIILLRAAKNKFNELGLKKLPTVKSINSEYSELTAKKKKAYSEYYSLKDKHREMLIHKSNIETILGISSEDKKREKTKDKTQDTIS